jgi:ferritin-like metal-binding protein YciE
MAQTTTRGGTRGESPAAVQIDTQDISQLEAGRQLLVQQLGEAHATEAALVTTLTAHIAMTPKGPYRNVLERHLQETKDQTQAIQERLGELGANRSIVAASFGLAQTVIGQALALSKGPIDMLRGRAGEEKLFKNAKDECATEALEIATYDGLEATARAIGDTRTAELAVAHREQEERMLKDLRELLPQLAEALVRAVAAGDGSYDVSTTGAAEGLRGVRDEVAGEAQELRDEVAGDAQELRDGVAARGKAAGKRFGRAAQGPQASDLPIAGYDKLTSAEIKTRLQGLSSEELDTIADYEGRNRNRRAILTRIEAERQTA